jgi:RNA polymerase sigma factor (sigma-70 family)
VAPDWDIAGMSDEQTTAAIQRYLDALPAETAAEPLVRDLLERAASRLRLLCGTLLYRSYPRLTHPPLNLETDEMLGGVVAGLLTAMQKVRPRTVRQFFALATQHMRWQLNDLARRLDSQPAVGALTDGGVAAPPPSSGSGLTANAQRMLAAIDGLPDEEREIFDLIRIQGLSYADAARIVDVSVKTVQRRLNRARLLLAEELVELRPGAAGESPPPSDDSSGC